MKHISNPLTIIGAFCTIAEVSGTVVLAYLSGWPQYVFLFFVIGFPIMVSGLFFRILNSKNYFKLYSPSDYPDPKAFVELYKATANVNEIVAAVIKASPPDKSNDLQMIKKELDNIMDDIPDFSYIKCP